MPREDDRNIDDVLVFREDISPFLIHLTKPGKGKSAKQILEKIIEEKKLIAGEEGISCAKWVINNLEKEKQFCRATSFTETPLNAIHCLVDIEKRKFPLEAYGLVFLKERLSERGVSPVLYLNNEQNDKTEVIEALLPLMADAPEVAKEILPLIATFGKGLVADYDIDFRWEREWRYPSVKGDFEFEEDDVFVGLCPHKWKDDFEELFPGVRFVDCRRNMKYYAKELVDAKDRFPDFKFSVV